ncbi:LysR substrate-binding domain-containing protein [Zobellella aerophila]|uniref:LysR substrate-binding domain-containing protein n=1 Tax=Zobellella aerophila TaxID=870480 RepID=A0ABP6VR18_9GAMM
MSFVEVDLTERRTDLAIRIGALQDSNLHARFLGRSPLHIVASPDYLERQGTPPAPEALGRHQIIGFADAPHLNRWPLLEPASLSPQLSGSSGETVRRLCLTGQGLALLSDFMICDNLASGRQVKVLDDQIATPNNRELVHAIYHRNTAFSNRITAFLDYIAPRLRLA